MGYEFESIKQMIGFKVAKIDGLFEGSERASITAENGDELIMKHNQDCCESVDIEEIHGDVKDLVGQVILKFEVASHEPESGEETPCNHGVCEWTFYKIQTNKADITIRWFGTSNGYYSTDVDLYFNGEWL